MNANVCRMRMPVICSEMNTNELEYDGGTSALGVCVLAVGVTLFIAGVAMALYGMYAGIGAQQAVAQGAGTAATVAFYDKLAVAGCVMFLSGFGLMDVGITSVS